jgi:hypothetical protein
MGVDGIIIKWFLEKSVVKVWATDTWLSIGIKSGCL